VLDRSAPRAAAVWTRVGAGVIDQGVASITNLVVCVVAARSLSARDFGIFSLALVVYVLALAIGRACSGQPLIVRHATELQPDADAVRAAAGAAVSVGAAIGAALVVVGALIGDEQGAVLIALGIGMPFLLLQDAYRFAFFACGRPDSAVVNDSLWFFGQVPLLLIAVHLGASPALFVIGWASGAALASAGGAIQIGVAPTVLRSRAWLRRHRDLIPYYGATFLFGSGMGQLNGLTLALTASVSAVGAYRGAWTLIGPLGVLLQGVAAVTTAEASRALRTDPEALRLLVDRVARLLCVVAAAFAGALALLLPLGLGRALLGATWSGASGLVLPLALGHVALALALAPAIALQAAERASLVMRIRVGTSVAVVVIGTLAGAVWGATGVAVAFCVVSAVTVPIWWRSLTHIYREPSLLVHGLTN
jgi:O-antigen/teichoic acid export membrane protein